MNLFAENSKRLLDYCILPILAFSIIYNIHFISYPGLTAGRIGTVILMACFLPRLSWVGVWYMMNAKVFSLAFALSFVWACFLCYGSGDYTMASRMFHFAGYVLIGGALFARACGFDSVRAMRAIALATIVQSLFIFLSYYDEGFRSWVLRSLVLTGNIEFGSGHRAPGLSNGGGAALGIAQACGVFACLYVGIYSRMRTQRSGIVWVLLTMLVAGSSIFVARTGLVFSMLFGGLFTVILFLDHGFGRSSVIVGVGGCTLISFLAFVDLQAYLGDFHYFWAFEFLFAGTDSVSVQGLLNQTIPPLTMETFIGTGMVETSLGSNASGNDSGYIQSYYALGLGVSVIFYFSLLVMFLTSRLKVSARRAMTIFAIVAFMAEVKEPFFFKYAMPFIMFSFLITAREENLRQPFGRGRTVRIQAIDDRNKGTV